MQQTAGSADRHSETTPLPSQLTFIGTPARQVAGQILSGDKGCSEIATELVDVLGHHNAILLAHQIAARVAVAARQVAL